VGLLERQRQGPEVPTAIDKPFDAILGTLGCEAVKAVVQCAMLGMAKVVQVCVGVFLVFELSADFLGQVLRVGLNFTESVFGAVEKGGHLD
jgi:hypothetical protein